MTNTKENARNFIASKDKELGQAWSNDSEALAKALVEYCNDVHRGARPPRKRGPEMRPIDGGDLMTVQEFMECCKSNSLTDDDGDGYYSTDKEVSDVVADCSSVANGVIDKRFTHVVWFNK